MMKLRLILQALLTIALLGSGSAPASAERTKLLEVDLQTGSTRRIDAAGPTTAADKDLDAMLDKATGGSAFSTDELERIEQALRRYLSASRPRAMPRLLLFLYPGRISRTSLRELREVTVDIELLVDPCGRAVCSESVGTTLELVGRSLRQPVLRTSRYTVRFGKVTIRTATELHGQSYDVFSYAAEEVVKAGQRAGGGAALISRSQQAAESYSKQMAQEIAKRLRLKRIQLSKPPNVQRDPKSASVELEIRSDRVRYKTDVLASLVGAAEALRGNPLTPLAVTVQVLAAVPMKTVEHKSFRCTGQALRLYLDGSLTQAELWSTYVIEKSQRGTRLTFDDAEASGAKSVEDNLDDGEDRSNEVLAANMNLLSPCLTAEAVRNHSFKGVTLTFVVTASGQATQVGARESGASATLRNCLKNAVSQIRFPRHGGSPRQVSYPMLIRR